MNFSTFINEVFFYSFLLLLFFSFSLPNSLFISFLPVIFLSLCSRPSSRFNARSPGKVLFGTIWLGECYREINDKNTRILLVLHDEWYKWRLCYANYKFSISIIFESWSCDDESLDEGTFAVKFELPSYDKNSYFNRKVSWNYL